MNQEKIRNIAIIAHVDHGKTTLVDAFIKQSKLFRENEREMQKTQILDSNELEREKGITILAKNISITYKDYKINIIDTPGHADFGGEVERTLNMADGCILVVDAQEGVMPQTEFVLKKAFELNLLPIVVINKIDKKNANIKRTLNKINDMFLSFASHESQLDFPVFYAIGREGKVFESIPEGNLNIPNSTEGNIQPLLKKIISYIPYPKGDTNGPFQMQISSLDHDKYFGRYLIGKVNRGKLKAGESVVIVKPDETVDISDDKQNNIDLKREIKEEKFLKVKIGTIARIFVRNGLKYQEVNTAETGDIVALTGIESTEIGATVCTKDNPLPLPLIKITPPSVKIKIEPNTSPLAGKEGKFVTAKQLEERLDHEKSVNIGLKIEKSGGGSYHVSGRGELQLSILIETMRREGYEFQVRKPEVIMQNRKGKYYEPLEKLYIDAPEKYLGTITKELNERDAKMEDMEKESGVVRFVYKIVTRKLLGLRSALLAQSRGTAVLNSLVFDYVPYGGGKGTKRNGVLIAYDDGVASGYSLNTVQERGDLFIKAGEKVYEGMIVGISKFDKDIDMNVTKERHKSAFRLKHDEITQTSLKQVIPLTLEYALVFLENDEMLEVTPQTLRLRKIYLKKVERIWSKRNKLSDLARKSMG